MSGILNDLIQQAEGIGATPDQLIPSIMTGIATLLPLALNIYLGIRQAQQRDREKDIDAESEFQERLIKLIEAQDEKIAKRDDKIDEQQATIDLILEENKKLKLENIQLRIEIDILKAQQVRITETIRLEKSGEK